MRGLAWLLLLLPVAGALHATVHVVCTPSVRVIVRAPSARMGLALPRWPARARRESGLDEAEGSGVASRARMGPIKWLRALLPRRRPLHRVKLLDGGTIKQRKAADGEPTLYFEPRVIDEPNGLEALGTLI